MWKVKSVKKKYRNLANKYCVSLSKDKEHKMQFESRLEAIIYIASEHDMSPWDGNFSIGYMPDGSAVISIFIEEDIFTKAGYYFYSIEQI